MNKFMSVVISLTMLLVAAGKVCAQTDSAQMAAKQYREDIVAVLNRMVEAGAVSAQARDSVIAVINSARSGSSQFARPRAGTVLDVNAAAYSSGKT